MEIDVDRELGSRYNGTVFILRIVGVVDVDGILEWGSGNGVSFAERRIDIRGGCAGIEECVNVVNVSVTIFDFDFYGGEMGMLERG